jgi:hypothetical protein
MCLYILKRHRSHVLPSTVLTAAHPFLPPSFPYIQARHFTSPPAPPLPPSRPPLPPLPRAGHHSPLQTARCLCHVLRLLGGGGGGGGGREGGKGGGREDGISSDELLPLQQLFLYRLSLPPSRPPSRPPPPYRQGWRRTCIIPKTASSHPPSLPPALALPSPKRQLVGGKEGLNSKVTFPYCCCCCCCCCCCYYYCCCCC